MYLYSGSPGSGKCVSRLGVGSRWTWCTLWWHSSTIELQAKGKLDQTHTPLGPARTAETGNPAFGCEMTDYNLEQSAAHWYVGTSPEGLTSTSLGSSAHEQFTSVQFITNSSWTASKSNAWLSTGAYVDLSFYSSLQDYGYLLEFLFFLLPCQFSPSTIGCYTEHPNLISFACINDPEAVAYTFNFAFPQKKERQKQMRSPWPYLTKPWWQKAKFWGELSFALNGKQTNMFTASDLEWAFEASTVSVCWS